MTGIRRHRHIGVTHRAGRAGAGVVFHVAHPAQIDSQRALGDGVFELGEDLRVRLLEDVRQDVQAAAMRHPDDRVTRALAGGAGDDRVEDRHQHVHALDREARLARERAVQKPFEDLDLRDAIEELLGARRIHRRKEAP